MPTSVKERLKTELEQAQSEGKQRAGRISDILKAAASMTFEELKEGSAELNVVTRKSVAEILTELQDTPKAQAEATPDATVAVETAAIADEAPFETTDAAPTWKSILRNAVAVVRDRRGDWLQVVKARLQNNAANVDQEIMDKYGDRYRQVKQFFQRVVEQINASKSATQSGAASESQPVSIEVVEDDAIVDVTPKVSAPESDKPAQS